MSVGISLIGRIVAASTRHPLTVLLAALAMTAAALVYLAHNFAMTAETNQLISPKLEWRKRGIEFDKAFPPLQNLTMIVIDGVTPELADDGAKRLASALQQRPDLFHNVRQPDGGRFFERNGLLLLPVDDVRSVTDALIKVQPPAVGAGRRSQPRRNDEDARRHLAGHRRRRRQAQGYGTPAQGADGNVREGGRRRASLLLLAQPGHWRRTRSRRQAAAHPRPARDGLQSVAAGPGRERCHSCDRAIAEPGSCPRRHRAPHRPGAVGGRGVRLARRRCGPDHGRHGRSTDRNPLAGGPLGAPHGRDPLHDGGRPGHHGGDRPAGRRPLQPDLRGLHSPVRRAPASTSASSSA